ncbi:putative allophanate hydrolase [Sulfitobacter noctilucae]|uniref:acetyl-CoA carboxylase biotin carboxyl carrier protein subunit n=1 Tax=Sulfitobacter noctilucae TaxID=1342302 RepID=UPI00046A3BA6|nr:acetyl-CoA carboxylase biotin carboxyl carrier protein subunit [Sulfitobacter noctilucae]KIN60567.1 putative allophanate hydrolase [Sulfitobacter noctilucae]
MPEFTLKSDVSGRVWQLLKSVGDTVDRDETVMVVEAMKMEIQVATETAGRIKTLLVAEGDEVSEDQPVAILETAT